MKTLLLVDRDRRTRREIRVLLKARHRVTAVQGISDAFVSIRKHRPDVVLVYSAAKSRLAVALLEGLVYCDERIPVVVLAGPGASNDLAKVRRLGARAALPWPTSYGRLIEAVNSACAAPRPNCETAPTITDVERRSNLTQLEQRLNRGMKCFAGANQVYLRSVILGNGVTTTPRVTIKCPLRAEFGLTPNVYYEYIRDRCCADSEKCSAVRMFRQRQREADAAALPLSHAATRDRPKPSVGLSR